MELRALTRQARSPFPEQCSEPASWRVGKADSRRSTHQNRTPTHHHPPQCTAWHLFQQEPISSGLTWKARLWHSPTARPGLAYVGVESWDKSELDHHSYTCQKGFSGTHNPKALAWQQPENMTQQDQNYQSSWLTGDQRSIKQLEVWTNKKWGHNGLVWTIFLRRCCYFLWVGIVCHLISDRKHALKLASWRASVLSVYHSYVKVILNDCLDRMTAIKWHITFEVQNIFGKSEK